MLASQLDWYFHRVNTGEAMLRNMANSAHGVTKLKAMASSDVVISKISCARRARR